MALLDSTHPKTYMNRHKDHVSTCHKSQVMAQQYFIVSMAAFLENDCLQVYSSLLAGLSIGERQVI